MDILPNHVQLESHRYIEFLYLQILFHEVTTERLSSVRHCTRTRMAEGDDDTRGIGMAVADTSELVHDTSSSFMDIQMDVKDVQNLIELEQRLEDSGQLDMTARKEYLETLRRCGMNEKLKDARYTLEAAFPFDEAMWLEWLQDESEALVCADDVVKLEELFRKSHCDCVSVSLWKEHIEYDL